MAHYVVIRCETEDEAHDIIADLLLELREYRSATLDEIYYGTSNLCEDISRVFMITKPDSEEVQ